MCQIFSMKGKKNIQATNCKDRDVGLCSFSEPSDQTCGKCCEKTEAYLCISVFLSLAYLSTDTDLLKHCNSYFLQNINTPLNNLCSTNAHTARYSEPFIYYQQGSRGACSAVTRCKTASSSALVQRQMCACVCVCVCELVGLKAK